MYLYKWKDKYIDHKQAKTVGYTIAELLTIKAIIREKTYKKMKYQNTKESNNI